MTQKNMRRLTYAQRGMTLIEIMVVVAILGMLGTIISVSYVKYLDSSKVEGTKIQMQNIVQALDAYKIQFGAFPTTEEGLQALVAKGVLKKFPQDKWNKDFEYIRTSSNAYTIKSYGADGVAGGEGNDADLTEQ